MGGLKGPHVLPHSLRAVADKVACCTVQIISQVRTCQVQRPADTVALLACPGYRSGPSSAAGGKLSAGSSPDGQPRRHLFLHAPSHSPPPPKTPLSSHPGHHWNVARGLGPSPILESVLVMLLFQQAPSRHHAAAMLQQPVLVRRPVASLPLC